MTGSRGMGVNDNHRVGMSEAVKLPLVLVLLLLSACSMNATTHDGRSGQAQAASPGPGLTSLLRATTSFDFEPAETPQELEDRVDVAVVGSVQSIKPVLLRNEGEHTGGVILTLEVEDSWKPPSAGTNVVNVVLHWPKNLGLGAFKQDLPEGSRVAFFGYEVDLPVDGEAGSLVLHDPDPQGLMLETPDGGLVNVWGEEGTHDDAWEHLTSLDALAEVLGAPE